MTARPSRRQRALLRSLHLILILVPLAAACGGTAIDGGVGGRDGGTLSARRPDGGGTTDTSDAGDAGPASIPLDGLVAGFTRLRCQKAYQCCSADDRARDPRYSTSEASCVYGWMPEGLPNASNNPMLASLAAGRIHYDGQAMAECLALMSAATCSAFDLEAVVQPAPCLAAFAPAVALGGACSMDGDCIGGWCDGGHPTRLGTCLAKKALGAACGTRAECLSNNCPFSTCVAPPTTGPDFCAGIGE